MEILTEALWRLARLGWAGLLVVGILDSSFLFLPLGNDLLMLTLAAREPVKLAWFAAWATLGSAVGSMIIDYLARKGGEQGLSRIVPPRRLDYVKRKVTRRAGFAIAVAALLPPPFPFTPVVAAAAALQFPRWKMLAVLLSARMLRFSLVGLLGMSFGPAILRLGKQPAVQIFLAALVAVCVIGSVWSVYGWLRRSPKAEAASVSV